MSLISTTFKDSIIYIFGLVLSRCVTLFTLPFLTNHFKPSAYAIIVLLMMLQPISRFIIPFEICQSSYIFFSDSTNEEEQKQYFSNGFMFTLLMNVIAMLSVLLLAPFISKYPSLEVFTHLSTLLIVTAAFMIDSISNYLMGFVRWQGQAMYYTLGNILIFWLNVISLIALVGYFELGLQGAFSSWLVSWTCGFIFFFAKTYRFFVAKFDLNKIKRMLKFSLPLLLNNLPTQLNVLLDRNLVLYFMGMAATGYYSAGLTVTALIGFFPMSLQFALWPQIYKQSQKSESKSDIIFLFYLTIVGLILIFIGAIFFLQPIMHLLIASRYHVDQDLVNSMLLVGLSYLIAAVIIFFPGMAIKRKTHFQFFISCVALSINVILGMLLTPTLGFYGIGLALIASSTTQVILTAIFSQRLFFLNYNFLFALLIIIIGGVMIFISHCLAQFFISETLSSLLKRGIIWLTLSGSCLCIMRIIWKNKGFSPKDQHFIEQK